MEVKFNVEIPLDDSYDVVIAGGGPAGCAAALAAARHGKTVLLLESSTSLGGMSTQGLVPAWCPFSDKEKIIYKGIGEEIFLKLKAEMPYLKPSDVNGVPIDAEALKRILDRLLTEAKVNVIFSALVVGVDVTAGSSGKKRVNYVVAAHKGGLRAWGGNVFIDCTGDADLVGYAGIERRHGDEKTGEIQPATHCFVITNADEHFYNCKPPEGWFSFDGVSWKAAKSEKYPEIKDGHFCSKIVGPGAIGFNAGHLWNVDPYDPLGISKNLMIGREIAYEYLQALREYLPQVFGAGWLAQTAPSMGLRETWRIIGDYELTAEDYFARRTFPDEIGRNCYGIDVHGSADNSKKTISGEKAVEESPVYGGYKKGESHGLPRGILQVKSAENLLAAGRNVSAEHKVLGSVRVMPVCFVMGQAAGVIAALTGKDRDIRSVDTSLLRETLKKDGAWFL